MGFSKADQSCVRLKLEGHFFQKERFAKLAKRFYPFWRTLMPQLAKKEEIKHKM